MVPSWSGDTASSLREWYDEARRTLLPEDGKYQDLGDELDNLAELYMYAWRKNRDVRLWDDDDVQLQYDVACFYLARLSIKASLTGLMHLKPNWNTIPSHNLKTIAAQKIARQLHPQQGRCNTSKRSRKVLYESPTSSQYRRQLSDNLLGLPTHLQTMVAFYTACELFFAGVRQLDSIAVHRRKIRILDLDRFLSKFENTYKDAAEFVGILCPRHRLPSQDLR